MSRTTKVKDSNQPAKPEDQIITYPPCGDMGTWIARTHSALYRRRVKRAIRRLQTYRLMTTGSDRLDLGDRVAVHRMLDTLTFDANRRLRGQSVKDVLGEEPAAQ